MSRLINRAVVVAGRRERPALIDERFTVGLDTGLG